MRLFSTARIAQKGKCDKIIVDNSATHIAVLCKGQFFVFNTLWPNGQLAILEPGLVKNFEAILNYAATRDPVESAMEAVGVLTAENRDQWASCRAKLVALSPKNAEMLRLVDTALFVVCLDDCSPESLDDRAANMLHGSYHLETHLRAHEGVLQIGTITNRWYDKLQLIVCENGAAGINFEHSAVDGGFCVIS
jgi:carnitine O-acetyltransferase